MAKYLVTGGCGFIGSHLAQLLIEKGHEVVILDNLSTGKLENAPIEAQVVIGDVTDYDTVLDVISGVNGCFHLAAIASVEKSITDWAGTHKVNSTATVNVFQAISRLEKKIPVIYTSSAAIYGSNPSMPLAEDSHAMPITAYGADKLSCELHGSIAWLVHHIPNIGIRPFNVYGPKQDPHSPYSGVISIFTNRIVNRQPIIIFGDGEQIRDFVYVRDIVDIFYLAMENLREGYDVINACTGRATSLNQLVGTIEEICGWKAEKHFSAARSGDIKVSIGDSSKLRNKYSYSANTSLKEGLSKLIIEKAPVIVMSNSHILRAA